MTDDITPGELSRLLADEIESVVADLAIDVKVHGRRKLVCFAPWNNHHNPKLEIDIGDKRGKWNDWIEAKYGDALSLVGCALTQTCEPRSKTVLSAAVRWARERYGIGERTFDRAGFEKRKAAAERRAAEREARAARELARARRVMQARWLGAHKLTPDTDGWKYLAARGIDLAAFKRQPRAVRFSPREDWFSEETGEVEHVGPALMSAGTLPDGRFGSLHRIWIDPSRPGEKADITPPRKMFPAWEGCAIRLWRGSTGLSEKEAAERRPLQLEDVVVGEGVEDGLSIAMLTPELRVHAAGSLPGLLSYVPPKVTRKLIIAADNDWGKAQALSTLNEACARFEREFKVPVFIARSPAGKDFNDALRGE